MLECSHDLVFRNSFKDIRCALETLKQYRRARYEFECCDTSHLTTAHLVELPRDRLPAQIR